MNNNLVNYLLIIASAYLIYIYTYNPNPTYYTKINPPHSGFPDTHPQTRASKIIILISAYTLFTAIIELWLKKTNLGKNIKLVFGMIFFVSLFLIWQGTI